MVRNTEAERETQIATLCAQIDASTAKLSSHVNSEEAVHRLTIISEEMMVTDVSLSVAYRPEISRDAFGSCQSEMRNQPLSFFLTD